MDIELVHAYGLDDCLPQLFSPEAPKALKRIVDQAREVLAKVKAPKPEDATVKADGKYVAECKADAEAKTVADTFLHNVAVQVLEEFADKPHVLYHLRQSDILSDVLKSEVEWHTYDADRSAPKVTTTDDERAALAADYRGLKIIASNFLAMIPDPMNVKFPAGTVKFGTDKSLEPNLEPLKGNYGASDGTVATGKYAKAWSLVYIIGTAEITDAREAIRLIWKGTKRVGISTRHLFELVDGQPWELVNKGETVKFDETEDRVEFSIRRISKD
jgi:hypothetical protein